MERLHIDLNEHSYDILTGHGLLDQAGTLIRRVWSGSRAVVLTDDTVRDLYGSRLEQSLSAAGISAAVFSVAPGEQSKSMKVLEHLLDFMASHGLTRSDLLIVLGGGVAGDLGGFAAACYMRGIAFVQIPTTLLAQVDSGVGGKTAERIIVDLRDKIKTDTSALSIQTPALSAVFDEALAALVMLGYKKPEAQKALKKLFDSEPSLRVEAAIKKALAIMK